MDINKYIRLCSSFNNAYFDKEHMWILYEVPTKPKLYWIDNKAILDMDYLQWI